MNMRLTDYGTYEDVASEYYDSRRHPTSANFREASQYFLRSWLDSLLDTSGWMVEVGAGDSLVAQELGRRRLPMNRLLVTDSSGLMLSYSDRWRKDGVVLTLSDANRLALKSSSAGSIVSILGDPYNESRFWNEVRRVLRPGGLALFTTPSFEWASAYREATKSDPGLAEFELRDGRRRQLASRILTPEEQISEVESAGLTVKEVSEVPMRCLRGPLSPKILCLRGPESSLVTGFVAIG